MKIRNFILKILGSVGVPFTIRYIRHLVKRTDVTVLCFHRIHPSYNEFWSPIHPDDFESILLYLKRRYEIISLSEIGFDKNSPKPKLVISFDDGYKDFIIYALPILKKHDIPSNQNVVIQCAEENKPIWTQILLDIFECFKRMKVTGSLPSLNERAIQIPENADYIKLFVDVLHVLFDFDQFERESILNLWIKEYGLRLPAHEYMNWEDIRLCADQGVEIGCHTWSHDVLKNETGADVLHKEIYLAKKEIEKKINREVSIMAMPNGQINSVVEKFIRNCGFRKILLVDDRIYYSLNSDLVPRINMVQESNLEMKLRISGFHSLIKGTGLV